MFACLVQRVVYNARDTASVRTYEDYTYGRLTDHNRTVGGIKALSDNRRDSNRYN